jgi:adenylyltransferase/sulfurtransferase
LAALEAIKILAGQGQPLWGRMQVIDSYQGLIRHVELKRDPNCSVCGALGERPE